MLDTTTPEIKFVIHSVRQASLLVKQVQAEMVSPAHTKDDRSPVTIADFAAQALVGQLIMQAFPNDPLVGEEDSATLRTMQDGASLERVTSFVSKYTDQATPDSVCEWIDHGSANPAARYWTLDPIDGTKGFLRGGQFAVALALVEDGEVQIGVLGCPNLKNSYAQEIGGTGSLVIAAHGEGTWVTSLTRTQDFKPLQVSDIVDPAQARLLRSFESAHTNETQMQALVNHLGMKPAPVLMDSQAKYAILAAGHGDLLYRLLSPHQPDYREKIWDQAAGSLVVEEAGGKVSDLDGKPLDFTTGRTLAQNRGVLASNLRLHDAALAAIKKINA
ncbi:MAG: 3'(2'),5'-bisphosphate nucleotidase [Chloroflexi bacterium]|nr:3'(2'),5'-bisphosphate nucleotidase [Chloroflexota bacterium]